jgi:hypothetical protein
LLAGIERRAAATIVLVALFCALGIALLPFLKSDLLAAVARGTFHSAHEVGAGHFFSQTLRLAAAF